MGIALCYLTQYFRRLSGSLLCFFLNFRPKSGGGWGDTGLLGHPYSHGPAAFISLERKQCLRYMYHFLFYTCISIPHEMLIFGDTLINMKTENRRKKFVHNLKALKKFLQSPKAKKKMLPTQNCPPSPPPQKNGPSLITAQRSKMTTSE